jgi:hypothetical protein
MHHEEAARTLGVAPASLALAPPAPPFATVWARIRQELPCSACGRPSRTRSVLHDPARGPRWLDRCRECFLATPPTLRVPPGQFLEGLRDAAADARLPLRTYTDEDGWDSA